MSAIVRRARKEDARQVGALWLRLLEEQAALEARLDAADDASERWMNDFPHLVDDAQYRVFVAERDGDLVGFITACLWTPPPIFAGSQEVYINEIYVASEARRQRVGRRLVEAVKAWAVALPAERLRLSVLAANAEGRAFWERLHAQPLSVTFTVALEVEAAPQKEKKKAKLGF